MQFVLYCNKSGKKYPKICAARNFLSEMYYMKGVIFFEKGKYLEDINQQKMALKWNPVKITSYMEILECYIKLKNADKFYTYFKEALSIALEPRDISIIYRKYAYLCIELKNYEVAYNILKYTNLIYYREENVKEIEYLSSIAKVKLEVTPDIGTINYIRENNIEYTPGPAVVTTYASMAKGFESYLEEQHENLTDEQEINALQNLVDIYTKLYFFECSPKTHILKLDAIKRYFEKTKNDKDKK